MEFDECNAIAGAICGLPPSSSENENTSIPISSPSPTEEGNCTSVHDSKLRSAVWQHFDKKLVNGIWKAVCKYCKKELQGDSSCGTSHLKNHYVRKHDNRDKDNMRQKVLTNNFNKEHPQLGTYSFDHDAAKKELACAIIMHEYPLSIVEHIGFKRYSTALQPLFKVPSRNTIKKEILTIYELEKVKTLNLLEGNASRIAITTDMWTSSNQKKGFMAVTAHFVDNSWHLQSRIMREGGLNSNKYATSNQAYDSTLGVYWSQCYFGINHYSNI